MAATITSTATRITISGNYKAFDSTTGSTSTVIQYSTGDAPASGDAGRFLMWKKDVANTDTWEIRYIESATTTTVTVGDGGFSSAPASGQSFVISTNLADIEAAEPVACTSQGNQYSFNDRDWDLTSNAFLGDVNKSIYMRRTATGTAFPLANSCAVQFGRLLGGEANDSVETTQGCHITFSTSQSNLLMYGGSSRQATGPVVNYYGCLLESDNPNGYWFLRMTGPNRMIGCVADGTMGGRFYHEASEWVACRHSGNINNATSWSLGATFTRNISGLVFYDSIAGFKNFNNFSGVFRDVVFTDTVTDVVYSSATNSTFDFIDCTTFDDTLIFDNGSGIINQLKSINYTLTDSIGTGLTGAKLAVYDTNGTLQTSIQTSTAGVVDEILAEFYTWIDNSPSTDKSPFDIRIRKYGYQYQGFQSSVSEPIKQEIRLATNTGLVSTEGQAAAITGISLNFSTETVTITSNHNTQSLYDYYQYQLAQTANMQYGEDLIRTGDAFDIDDWDIVIDGATYTGDITTTGTATFLNSAILIGSITDSGGTTTRTQLNLTGLQSNSEVRIYQAGTSTEIDGVENSGTSFSTTTTESSIDLVIFNTQYQPVRILSVDTSGDVTLPIQQIFDRNYNNP